jgi:hypothetical protein
MVSAAAACTASCFARASEFHQPVHGALKPGVLPAAAPSSGADLEQLHAKAPWEQSGELAPRVTEQEAANLSAEQIAFLDRKRRGIMPQGSVCGGCGGSGIIVCHRCKGSGVNDHQVW